MMSATRTKKIEPLEASRQSKDSRLNLRVSTTQEQLIRRAATATGRSVTDFVLDSAAQHAETVLAERRWFILSDDEFGRFEELLEAPLEPSDALRSFLATPPSVDLSDL
jgi:uncharacterized protein (DUF1778 family)